MTSSRQQLAQAVKDYLQAAPYLLGWRLVQYVPESVTTKISQLVVERFWQAPEQWQRNLARFTAATPQVMKKAQLSYLRYWFEAFRLPSMKLTPDRFTVTGEEFLAQARAENKPVILTLPHSGNWDMAGVWLVNNYGSFTTVAENLKPELVYREFVNYRQSLGFEVLGLDSPDVFAQLKQRLEQGGMVCLLGERDLKSSGVLVDFAGEPALFPPGPALLAQQTGAVLLVVHATFTATGWHFEISAPVNTNQELQEVVQDVATAMAHNLQRCAVDWHVLQPLWLRDLDEQRLLAKRPELAEVLQREQEKRKA